MFAGRMVDSEMCRDQCPEGKSGRQARRGQFASRSVSILDIQERPHPAAIAAGWGGIAIDSRDFLQTGLPSPALEGRLSQRGFFGEFSGWFLAID